VIGKDGSLTGFGGGLPTKRFLLSMESRVADGDLFGAVLQGAGR
jgi:methylated-DNA-[protein]-cysteine S-methyltransferase